MQKKIFITGVAGFVGSNLAETLINLGHVVVGFDNLSQGSLLNLESFQSNPRFQFIQGDIRNLETLLAAAKNCEVIFHLAAFKIPRYGNAYDTLDINSRGTLHTIEAAIQNQAHLIFTSTSDVYGRNPQLPFSEESDLVLGAPSVRRWAYALSKAFDEQLIFAERERRRLEFTIVRLFGGYGPNQNLTWWGGPQSVFIEQAFDGKPLTIHGDGQQTRSFTFISDHIQGLLHCMNKAGARNGLFNLGSREEITIADLAKKIWCKIHPQLPPLIQWVPYSTFGNYNDVLRRVPDLTLSQQVLGFTPQWTLDSGLELTIEWQKKRRLRTSEQLAA